MVNLARPRSRRTELPASGAGLIRYFDEEEVGTRIRPEYVLLLVAVIVIIEVYLHTLA